MISGSELKRYTLMHPPALKPEDVLSFIHHPIFTQDWKDLGLDDDDLAELELCAMISPAKNPIAQGTCGVRLLQVTPDARSYRPAFRVIVFFVLFEHRSIAALLAAEHANGDLEITQEDRIVLCDLIEEIEVGLAE